MRRKPALARRQAKDHPLLSRTVAYPTPDSRAIQQRLYSKSESRLLFLVRTFIAFSLRLRDTPPGAFVFSLSCESPLSELTTVVIRRLADQPSGWTGFFRVTEGSVRCAEVANRSGCLAACCHRALDGSDASDLLGEHPESFRIGLRQHPLN